MLIVKRFLVFFLPLYTFATFSLFFVKGEWFYSLSAILLLVLIFCLFYLVGRKTNPTNFLNLMAAPVMLVSSSLIFYLFLENQTIEVIVSLIVSALIFVFFNMIFYEFYKKVIIQFNNFKQLIFYFQLFSLWFIASAIFALIIFLNFSIILLIATLIIILLIFFEQFIWSHDLVQEKKTSHYLIFLVVFCEMIIILNLLPLNFYFKGLCLTALYYIFIQSYLITTNNQIYKKSFNWQIVTVLSALVSIIILSNIID